MRQLGLTLLLQKPRMPQIQGVQGRSRSILLRALGNEGDGASSAFPPGKKHDKFFICFRSNQKLIYELCLNVFKCHVIILFFYILSCFLCNCRANITPCRIIMIFNNKDLDFQFAFDIYAVIFIGQLKFAGRFLSEGSSFVISGAQ